MEGKLVVFEGTDGVGKSTLATRTAEWLSKNGHSAISLSFPGHVVGTLGHLINEIHHHHSERFGIPRLNPLSLQTLHVAAHIDEIDRAIRPALDAGTWVVLDRYWWSTWVYGVATGANHRSLELVIDAEKNSWGAIKPSLYFLVKRPEAIRPEHPQDTFQKLSTLYEQIAAREGGAMVQSIVNLDLEKSFASVIDSLNAMMKGNTTYRMI